MVRREAEIDGWRPARSCQSNDIFLDQNAESAVDVVPCWSSLEVPGSIFTKNAWHPHAAADRNLLTRLFMLGSYAILTSLYTNGVGQGP